MKYNIISIPRSGSGYLRSLMAKNLEINEGFYSISEPFNSTKNHSLSYNEIIKRMQMNDTVVTKNHVSELIELKQSNEYVYNQLFAIHFNHICLLRKDIFECTMSRCIAIITRQWNEYTYSVNDLIVVPEYFFVSELQSTLNMWSSVSNNEFGISYRNVLYYEDLTFVSELDCQKIGVPYNGVNVISQQSPNKNVLVKNIDSLKEVILREINTIPLHNVTKDGWMFSLDNQS